MKGWNERNFHIVCIMRDQLQLINCSHGIVMWITQPPPNEDAWSTLFGNLLQHINYLPKKLCIIKTSLICFYKSVVSLPVIFMRRFWSTHCVIMAYNKTMFSICVRVKCVRRIHCIESRWGSNARVTCCCWCLGTVSNLPDHWCFIKRSRNNCKASVKLSKKRLDSTGTENIVLKCACCLVWLLMLRHSVEYALTLHGRANSHKAVVGKKDSHKLQPIFLCSITWIFTRIFLLHWNWCTDWM